MKAREYKEAIGRSFSKEQSIQFKIAALKIQISELEEELECIRKGKKYLKKSVKRAMRGGS